jgi:hypothetical protein
MWLGVGASAAYVYGAKAGRGRYDQIVAWYRQMRGKATELQTEAQRKVSEQSEKMGRTTSGASGTSGGTSPTGTIGATGMTGTTGATRSSGPSGTMPPPKDAPAG